MYYYMYYSKEPKMIARLTSRTLIMQLNKVKVASMRTKLKYPPHSCLVKFRFSVWQDIVFHTRQTCKKNKQTHLLKQNFSETITPID